MRAFKILIAAVLVMWACSTPRVAPDEVVASTSQEPEVTGFITLAAAPNHACALHSSGRVYCWGANDEGQLGTGNLEPHNEPVEVKGLVDAVSVSVGLHHSCALHKSGRVSCWGRSELLGHIPDLSEESRTVSRPSLVRSPGGTISPEGQIRAWCPDDGYLEDIISLDIGSDHTCAVHQSGSVLCWGSNRDQHTGAANANQWFLPCPMPVEGVSDATEVTAGPGKTCAFIGGQEVLCWGWQKGPDFNIRLFQPRPKENRWIGMALIEDFAGAEEVFLGAPYHCARWADGRVACGQGLGESTSEMVTVEGVAHFARGPANPCFLHHDGSRTCTSNESEPVEPPPLWERMEELQELAVLKFSDPLCGITPDHRLICTHRDWRDGIEQVVQEYGPSYLDGAPADAPDAKLATAADTADPTDCPQDLVFGDSSWPNHIRFERRGMSRTFYFENTVAEFGAEPGDDLHMLIHFPDLRFGTSEGEKPRVDGWEAMTVFSYPEEVGKSWTMGLGADRLQEQLGCFILPPQRFGSLTLKALELPEEDNPMVGSVAGVFESTLGSWETGKVSGAFETDQVVRDAYLPIDPEANESIGFVTPESHPDNERIEGRSGRAYYRPKHNQLLVHFTDGNLIHGRQLTSFDGHQGTFLFNESEIFRFQIDQISENRIKGVMTSFSRPLDGNRFFFQQQLLDPAHEPTSVISFRFDLPLLTLPDPGEVQIIDETAPLEQPRALSPLPGASTALLGTHRFEIYESRNSRTLTAEEMVESRVIEITETPEGLSWQVDTEANQVAHSMEILTHRESLTHKSTTRSFGDTQVRARQIEGQVEIAATDGARDDASIHLDRTAPIFDVHQLLLLIPALQLEPTHLYRINLLHLNQSRGLVSPAVQDMELVIQGTETIHFHNQEGEEARRVELRHSRFPHIRWLFYLSLNEPSRLLAAVDNRNRLYLPTKE